MPTVDSRVGGTRPGRGHVSHARTPQKQSVIVILVPAKCSPKAVSGVRSVKCCIAMSLHHIEMYKHKAETSRGCRMGFSSQKQTIEFLRHQSYYNSYLGQSYFSCKRAMSLLWIRGSFNNPLIRAITLLASDTMLSHSLC